MAKLQIPSASSDEIKEFSVSELVRTLYAHRVGLLTVFGLFLALGILLSFMPRFYKAEAVLWVQPGETSSMAVSNLASSISGQQNDIVASEVLALQSRTLLLRVAKELDLVNDRDFWGVMAFMNQPSPADRTLDNAVTRDKVFKKISRVVSVSNDGKDEVIYIDVTTLSPKLSAKIANTLVNDYLAYLLEMRYGANQRASAWLIDQLGDLKKRVDKDQVELIRLQDKLGLIGFSTSSTDYLYGQSLGDLMKASDEAKIARIVAEAKLRYLSEADPNLIEGEIHLLPQPSDVASQSQSLLASLRASRAQVSSNYARLSSLYGPNFPEVKQLKAQLDQIDQQVNQEQKRILNQAKLSFDAPSANEKMTTDKVEKEKARVFGSSDDMARFSLLTQDYQADRSLYKGLLVQLQTAGIQSGLQAGDIDIVDLADVPGKPTILGPLVYLPGSIVLGAICGVFFAVWIASLDQRVRGPEHVEKLTGLHPLAQLPHFRQDKEFSTDGQKLPPAAVLLRSHYAEAVQSLRTSLLLSRPGSPPKVILVASSTPGEGKSNTVINLGATFARHSSKVLIIDCDLRKGVLAERFRISASKGLTSVLTRHDTIDAAIQEIPGVSGLYILPDGPKSPDPAVLISSDEMKRVVELCRDRFDFILLDTPPVLGIADALELGQLADAVVLITRERVSNAKAVKEAAEKMISTNLPVVGFVYNDVDPRMSAYGYGYAYGDYYREYYRDEPEADGQKGRAN